MFSIDSVFLAAQVRNRNAWLFTYIFQRTLTLLNLEKL